MEVDGGLELRTTVELVVMRRGFVAPAMVGLRRKTVGAFTTLWGPVIGLAVPGSSALLPRRCSIRAFCCCLTFSMDRTCSIADGSSRMIVNPITTGDIGVLASEEDGLLISVLMPLIVTRRRFVVVKGFVLEGTGASLADHGG